jgi:hypothetical protein
LINKNADSAELSALRRFCRGSLYASHKRPSPKEIPHPPGHGAPRMDIVLPIVKGELNISTSFRPKV